MFTHYLKIAFRNLWKYKVQSVINIVGLMIGFAAFFFASYWYQWEHNFDTFHPEVNRTYEITTTGIAKASDGSPTELDQLHINDANFFLQSIPEIETHSSISWARIHYKEGEKKEDMMGLSVDTAFFSMFYSEFVSGSYLNIPFDGTHIVLTEKAAIKYFGKIDCAGEVFQGENGSSKIAGVIKNYPSNTDFHFDFLRLSRSIDNGTGRASFFVRLYENADVKLVRKKIEEHKSVAQVRWNQDEVKNWTFRLRTLSEVHLNCHPELKSRFHNIQLLRFAGILAMLCSLMNCLVLFIGQQQRKYQKNKTFKSIGASNAYLFCKGLADLCLPLLIAIFLSAVALSILFPYYQEYTQWQNYGIYENYINKIDLGELFGYSARWMGIVISLFLLFSSCIIARMLKNTSFQASLFLRNTLIVAQIFIGCFFFFISLSLCKQYLFTQNKDKGIDVENITQIDLGFDNRIVIPSLKEELLRNPLIEDVTCTTDPVLTGMGDHYLSYISAFAFEDNLEEKYSDMYIWVIEPNFFEFFRIKLIEGNWIFDKKDMLINETQIRALGDKNPLNNTIRTALGENIQIRGVVSDYNYSTMQYPIKGLFFHLQQDESFTPPQYVYIKTKPENRIKAIEYAETILKNMAIGEVSEGTRFRLLTDILDELSLPEKTLFQIFGILALASLLVVSFGIFSLVTLTIEQRKKEIGIRKINGAKVSDILLLFIKNYLLLVVVGNVLSLPIAYFFINRWMESYVYRTNLGGWLFAVVFITTGLTVIISVFEKVRIAANENPAEIIKSE